MEFEVIKFVQNNLELEVTVSPLEETVWLSLDDMANLFAAIYALKKIAWFKSSVRDIRAFKVENWSDFTQIVKEQDE